MSSTDPAFVDPRPGELPPALASMWRVFRLGYQHEPRLLLVAFTLTLVASVPDALQALWLKLLADGVAARAVTEIAIAAGAMALCVTLSWLLRIVSTRATRRFRDKVTIALETHVAQLQASVSTLEHHERADFLDRLAVLRNQVFVLDHMYLSVLSTCGWIVRLGVTVALLATIHPALVLLVLFAVPTVVSSARRPAAERQVEERFASHQRRAEHLFRLATTPGAGKEVRITGIGDSLVRRRRSEWEQWFVRLSRARWRTAVSYALAWAVFGLGFAAAVVFVVIGLRASVGSVLLILAAGARLSSYLGQTVGEIGFLRGVWMDGSRRLVWLERYVASLGEKADRRPPERLQRGLRLERVDFAYPGSDTLVLQDVELELPAGSVVAVVGENGAGKSTLVKLLAKMYEPTRGAIFADDVPLARVRADDWRQRLAGAFQDFYRFELIARPSVGVGDLDRADDAVEVRAAVGRAGAVDVIERLPSGLDSQLGATWPEGQELSFGQWQKVALARGYMRHDPLLMILDEPTAALDAETEHDLFERYADAAHHNDAGGITILVSHRFSTVRMADLILVLDGSRLVEFGSHERLLAAGGRYAELYRIQAAAYH